MHDLVGRDLGPPRGPWLAQGRYTTCDLVQSRSWPVNSLSRHTRSPHICYEHLAGNLLLITATGACMSLSGRVLVCQVLASARAPH